MGREKGYIDAAAVRYFSVVTTGSREDAKVADGVPEVPMRLE